MGSEVKLILGDCLQKMKELPDNSVDAVITDPPYNVLSMEWDKEEINWDELAEEFYRILKINGSIYIFGQFPMICSVYNSFSRYFKFKQDLVWYKNRGFSLADTIYTKYHENILFFFKGNENIVSTLSKEVKQKREERGWTVKEAQKELLKILPEFNYYVNGGGGWLWFETGRCPTLKEYLKLIELLSISDNYRILFDRPTFNFDDIKLEGTRYKITREAQKLYGQKSNLGEFTQKNNGTRNPKTVLEYPIIQSGEEYTGHPTQKPVKLIRYLLTASSRENELVLDPFMGSGTTGVACMNLNRNFIGIEIDEGYFKIAEKRINEARMQTKLFEQAGVIGGASPIKKPEPEQTKPYEGGDYR
jgi:DNA modification methylase